MKMHKWDISNNYIYYSLLYTLILFERLLCKKSFTCNFKLYNKCAPLKQVILIYYRNIIEIITYNSHLDKNRKKLKSSTKKLLICYLIFLQFEFESLFWFMLILFHCESLFTQCLSHTKRRIISLTYKEKKYTMDKKSTSREKYTLHTHSFCLKRYGKIFNLTFVFFTHLLLYYFKRSKT